jgi:hypothetical protein
MGCSAIFHGGCTKTGDLYFVQWNLTMTINEEASLLCLLINHKWCTFQVLEPSKIWLFCSSLRNFHLNWRLNF